MTATSDMMFAVKRRQYACMFASQVKPSVIPLFERLLSTGTFQATALDSRASADEAIASASDQPEASSPAADTEHSMARLVFTAEKAVPWLEKLVTQIKVG